MEVLPQTDSEMWLGCKAIVEYDSNKLFSDQDGMHPDNQEDPYEMGVNAYLDENGLFDICLPDYYTGPDRVAVIPLPWWGTAKDLYDDVMQQIEEFDAQSE